MMLSAFRMAGASAIALILPAQSFFVSSFSAVSSSALGLGQLAPRARPPSQNERLQMSASGLVESGSAGVKDEDWEGIWVMMNGLPGNMGKEVAAACLRKGFRIAPFALTGPDVLEESITVDDQEGNISTEVKLVRSNDFERCDEAITEIKKREALMSVTEKGGRYAVIAPNMGKQIVALQTAIDVMAKEFPKSFSGYKLEITESHQSTKADTSGTAKALAADFAALTGEDYDMDSITKIRDREGQLAFGVPEEHLSGHAFHTYSLKSDDGTVEFQFRHNVGGRRMYAEGTADAVAFLAARAKEGAEKRIYSMLDVLRLGGI